MDTDFLRLADICWRWSYQYPLYLLVHCKYVQRSIWCVSFVAASWQIYNWRSTLLLVEDNSYIRGYWLVWHVNTYLTNIDFTVGCKSALEVIYNGTKLKPAEYTSNKSVQADNGWSLPFDVAARLMVCRRFSMLITKTWLSHASPHKSLDEKAWQLNNFPTQLLLFAT